VPLIICNTVIGLSVRSGWWYWLTLSSSARTNWHACRPISFHRASPYGHIKTG